jgi:hypothetical protein
MVLASNVDLDLNGCVLVDTSKDNQSIGILVDHQQNVTIRNGSIRGFQLPIVFDDHTKRVTWPGNDLASGQVAVQSVDVSKEAPIDRENKPHAQATAESPQATASPTPSSGISGEFLDRYDATKSSPQALPVRRIIGTGGDSSNPLRASNPRLLRVHSFAICHAPSPSAEPLRLALAAPLCVGAPLHRALE